MKTYRKYMQENNENLSWCKPMQITYNGKTAIIAQNEGEIVSLKQGKRKNNKPKDNDYLKALISYLGLSDYEIDNLADLYNSSFDGVSVDTEEMACCDCPWFKECDAMDEEYNN